MIQRIQTVFLLLAIAALGLFLWLPLIRFEAGSYSSEQQGWNITHYYNGYLYFINAILAGTAIGITLINIFLYKRRSLQMLLCWFAVILIVSAQGYVYYKYQTKVYIGDVIFRKWNILSLAAAGFEILALISIRKDEQTIQDLERLR